MQNRYWDMMTQFKFSLFYLDEHFGACVRIDRIITIFLAIAASTSIGGWAIWQQYAFVWALIIAASQVLGVINQYLPYKKRIKEIAELKGKLTPVYNETEYKWLNVQKGELTDQEINDLCYKYNKQWSELDGQFFQADVLPSNEEFIKAAERRKNEYFAKMF